MKLLDKALQLRDPELAARFRREQVLGYDALEAKGSIATSLRTVSPADAASMETTPDVLRNESKAATNGNLLLLQGRPHEARLAFEAALNVIHDPVIRLRLYADVARAIKAEDGVIVHANEYMRKALASVINGDVEKDRLSNSVDRPTTQP